MNKKLFDTKFQYFPSKVYITEPLGEISLSQFIRAIKNPKPEMKEVFLKIAQAGKENNLKTKDWLKANKLFYVTPSLYFNGKGRKYEDVVRHLPFLVIEFDKTPYASELKKEIFEKFDSCICAFLSPSKTGCKFVFHIPVVESVDSYKELYCGLFHFLEPYNADPCNFNPSLPLFISWDEDILVRDNPNEWVIRGYKENSMTADFDIDDFEYPETVSEEDTEEVRFIFRRAIENIKDNGHPQLVRSCTALGGHVAANLISYDEAKDLIDECIENNNYLQKSISTYKKSAYTMLQRGMNRPLLLKNGK